MKDFPSPSFAGLSLSPPLLQNLESLGYVQMTPVQAQSLPPILAGQDVIAQAKTGSGKTAAFGLGLLSHLEPGVNRVQALVLCPTRELADQVSKEIRRLARSLPNIKVQTLCGGMPLHPQVASLSQHDPHVVVGTPGRIQELLRKKHLHLAVLKVLVLDEADRMLDMGFEDQINEIISKTPPQRQTLLFSATYPDEIRSISHRVQRKPLEITVESTHSGEVIEQHFFDVDHARKLDALANLLIQHRPESAVVFCNTKIDTEDVANQLRQRGFSSLSLQGDLEQRERDEVLLRFANRSSAVLVATDVAARGLDIKDLAAVINYELPKDPDIYLHRIGRTGRAGQKGLALSLVSGRETNRVKPIENQQGSPVRWGKIRQSEKSDRPAVPARVTLRIDGGRKDKLRPGDILGALTGAAGLDASAVGKIDIFDTRSYVAIDRKQVGQALERLSKGKIKNRNFRVRPLEN
jgi:ATP-independent RNA helicase DbpA